MQPMLRADTPIAVRITSALALCTAAFYTALIAAAALFVFFGMPLRPTGASLGSQITCVTVAALAVGAGVYGSRRPGRAFVLLVVLSALGVMFAVVLGSLAARTVLPPSTRFPVWQLALIIGGSVASVWHGRTLYRLSGDVGRVGSNVQEVS